MPRKQTISFGDAVEPLAEASPAQATSATSKKRKRDQAQAPKNSVAKKSQQKPSKKVFYLLSIRFGFHLAALERFSDFQVLSLSLLPRF